MRKVALGKENSGVRQRGQRRRHAEETSVGGDQCTRFNTSIDDTVLMLGHSLALFSSFGLNFAMSGP